MASSDELNGPSTSDDTQLPPSLQLQQLHLSTNNTDGGHHDLSASVSSSATAETSAPTSVLSSPSLPANANGKRSRHVNLDLESESAFPSLSSLGAASSGKATIWGSASSKVRQASQPSIGDAKSPSQGISTAPLLTTSVTKTTASGSMKRPDLVTETLSIEGEQQVKHKEFGAKASGPADIVRQIMAKTNTQIEMSTSQKTGTTTFLVKGKVNDVAKAKRELLSGLSQKVTYTLQVPQSVTPFIIGRKGQTLKAISERTNARINVQKKTADAAGDVSNQDELIDVTIEGDTDGAKAAKIEIEAIVHEKMSKETVRISHIEHQFYPLIAGANNTKLQEICNDTNCKIHIPLYTQESAGDADHSSANSRDIIVAGDKEDVAKALQTIEELYEDLKRITRTITITIPKRQHKYLTGQKGQNLQEILAATGCTVALSAIEDPSDTVVIRGPEGNLVNALSMVMEKANSTTVDTLNIVPAHRATATDPVNHAKRVVRYLSQRQKFRKVSDERGVKIYPPHDSALTDAQSEVVIEIVGKESSNVQAARKEIVALVNSVPPILLSTVSIEPLLHRHIIGRQGKNIQRMKDEHGVHIIVPDSGEEDAEVLLVFEGKEGEAPPSDRAERERIIKERIDAVQSELNKISQEAADFTVATLNVPSKFHRQIIGPKGTTLNAIIGVDGLVSVRFPSTSKSVNGSDGDSKKTAEDENTITIKGPKEHVDRVKKDILQLVEESKHADIMASYNVEFTFPSQYSGQVIGRGGANLTKLKDQLGVQVDIEDKDSIKGKAATEAKVTITGIKKNVEEAKARIMEQVEQLVDHSVSRVSIPAEHHASLIGASGRYVRRLEDKYNVRIWFPRNRSSNDDSASTAGGDDDGEPQKQDEVVIKGGKNGVAAAKSELLELLEYEKEHGHVARFTVPAKTLPHVVGKAGKQIQQIKDETETRIDVVKDDSGDGTAEIVVQGKKEGVAAAKKAILAIANEHEAKTTITSHIDPQYHKFLIGPSGSKLRDIVIKAGGPDGKGAQLGMVKFPAPGSGESVITLAGDPAVVDKIKKEFEAIVDELKSKTTIGFAVPKVQHSTLIGRGGASLRELQDKYKVEVLFPGSRGYKQASIAEADIKNIPASDLVKVSGRQEACDAAKEAILSKVLPMQCVNIPRKYHRAIANNGATFRKLRSNYKVIVDHGSAKLPTGSSKAKTNGSAAPTSRIDDDDDAAQVNGGDDYDWDVRENIDEGDDTDGDVPWNLKGEDSKLLERAEKYITDLLKEVSQYTHTGHLTVPQSKHRFIIGRGGSTVTKIRDESGCKIDVPNNQNSSVIVITGSKAGIETARELILEAIEKAK